MTLRGKMTQVVVVACVVAALRILHGQDSAYPRHVTTPDVVPPAPASPVVRDTPSGTEITGTGVVTRLLPDDTEGDRHQRFVLRLADGHTLLVAHNVDIAPRVTGLHVGDAVDYRGEFAPNRQGGVVHWTHRDPAGRHEAGWIKHDGQVFE